MTDSWEEVEVPQGAYMSWASRPGQRVVGKVIDYEPQGGTDFDNNPCPLITLRLSEDTYAVSKDGDRRNYAADDMIMINCGLYNLKQAVKFANLSRGDMIDIHYHDLTRVDKGDAKQFKIRVLRARNVRDDHQREPVTSGAPRYEGTVPRNDRNDDPPF